MCVCECVYVCYVCMYVCKYVRVCHFNIVSGSECQFHYFSDISRRGSRVQGPLYARSYVLTHEYIPKRPG